MDKINSSEIRTSTRKVQGLDCYVPVLTIYENGKKIYSFTPAGDPLVTRKDALKYARLHANDLRGQSLFDGELMEIKIT